MMRHRLYRYPHQCRFHSTTLLNASYYSTTGSVGINRYHNIPLQVPYSWLPNRFPCGFFAKSTLSPLPCPPLRFVPRSIWLRSSSYSVKNTMNYIICETQSPINYRSHHMFSTVATSVDVATATVVTRRVKKKSTKIKTKTKATTSTKGEVTTTLRKKKTTKTEKLTNIKPPTSSNSSSNSNNDASIQHREVDSDVTAVSTSTTATIEPNSTTPTITAIQPSTELLQTNPIVHTITLNGNLKKRGIDIGNLPTTTNSTRNRNSRKRGVQWTLKFTNPVSKEDKKKLQEQRQRIVVVGDPLPTLIRKNPIEPPNGETIAAPNTNDNTNNDTNNNDTTKNEEMIQLQRERRNASQFIPMWLRREVSWREAVFQHLNLPTNTTKAKSSSYNAYERRNFGESLQGTFYEDTIPNFSEVLRNGTPPSLYDALDILVEQGLGDPSVAERYRTTCRIRLQSMESFTAFSEMKEQIKYRQGLVQQLSTDLIELHERLKALESDPNATTTTTTANSSVPNTASDNESIDSEAISVTNLDHINDGTEQIVSITDTDVSQFTEIDIDPATAEKIRHDRIMNLQKMISEKGTNLKIHQYHVDRLAKKLNDLRKVGQEPPMEKEEFQKITEAANRARHSITLAFANHARDLHSKMLDRYQVLDSKTDLTKPHEWYLHARLHKRKIIYHGGPTNSGKTYQALQRLKAAEKGMYVGPLRLLAAEIWERLTAEGIYCNLFTGQEFRSVPFATHKAATVEMVALQEDFDVVVIDEIQMINDKERGFAWTRALLGLRCREIHVCGGLEATDVVKRLVAACGDEFELRTYERFSELEIESSSLASMPDQLGTYKNIQAGDCIVAFSRNDIFAIKREIETNTKHKCCVIYGSLPPSTRSEQARRFNDPNSGYDVLVASDAIGMGMNLNIRRIILNSIFKNDGFNIVRLDHSSVKQISGRAGRRNSPFPNGFVTTRDPRDLDYLRQCLSTEIEPIAKAGLLPTATHIQTFSDALEQLGMQHGTKNLHKILQQFNDIASVKSDFFVCRQDPMVHIAKAIAPYDMAIPDKYTVCQSPVSSHRDTTTMDIVRRFAAKRATGQSSGLTKNMIPKPPKTFGDLARLCLIFNELELFLWLQRKFPPGNMIEQQAANSMRERAIVYISDGLNNAEELDLSHCYVKRDRGVRAMWTKSQTELDDMEEEFKPWK